ncbi:translation initiation factor IF-2 [Polluticoccus soli]|uniref:translation initiation factor IF-2 n=1 Tax=Polluticoccus soli TaxID=3034150 RepID=UPI0023E2962B|nr:translation initiation factor IF-2 [Flavipsychrobacter sp. JY13-12]
MATATKTPRLLAAAKEFNIGKETLVEFLTSKGFEINASNPNTKLTEVMYDALQAEFAQDKAAKRKSEEIALPKGSLLDSLKKNKEDLDLKAKKEEPEAPKVEKKKEEKPKEVEKPKEAEKPKEVEAPKPAPVKEEEAAPVAEAAPVVEEKPKVVVEKKETPAEPEPQEEAEQHIEVKAPKLEGPNILGKINLDEMNLSSRPKKGAAKKKTEKAEEAPEETPAPAPAPTPVAEVEDTEAKKKKAPKKQEEETALPAPQPPVAEQPAPQPPVQPAAPVEDDKPEHIEMKAPKLEGPKIIGKIELPVAESKGDSKEKRNRKRIPVQKKPESFRPDQQGQGGGQGQGQGGGGYQGQRGGQGQGGGGYQGQRGGQGGGGYQGRPGQGGGGYQRGGGQGGQRGPGQGGDRRGGQRFGQPAPTPQQQEIDAKAIQDKIRQTQAKLAGNTRGKSSKSKYRRNKRDEMAEKRMAAEQSEQGNVIQVTEFISVAELASLLDVSFAEVISKCMSLGIMVSINQRLDAEVIELVSSEFGYDVEFINLEQEADIEEEEEDNPEDLIPRAPIVTIMGHVDHGKTSLLDYIRSANVVAGEAGGITQHIGAYRVVTSTGKQITFLDTPGHEAFTAMRARGAKVADVAVIVVAADDAIMPQTKEAISHAQAASLPMIFAINKIDKEGANPEKIKEQLAGMNILVEDWGGKFQSQEISAKKGLNIDLLLEKIGLEAELLELKANPERDATGSVIEASLDKGRGYQATILVQNGTLEQGDMIVCGQYYGKIKAMFNERGQRVDKAGPSAPVQVLGLNGAPQAGEKFKVYEDEDEAKEVANHRAQIMREQGIRTRKHITLDEIGRRLALGNFKELGIIIKGDFDGSVEALSDSLQKLSTEEVAVNVVHKGVGQITESDVLLATASDAIIIGFQVRPSMQAARLAEQENIEIRTYSIIYDAIEEIKSAMEGLLEPKIEKKTVCHIEVREVFKITGVGTIAGCYVLDGKINRNTKVNLVRDGIVVYTGELASLKRFKDDVKEVSAGYECGLSIKNYNDIRMSDIIEGFEEVEVKRTL